NNVATPRSISSSLAPKLLASSSIANKSIAKISMIDMGSVFGSLAVIADLDNLDLKIFSEKKS
ncbi:hypothetical protein L9F63_004821, partial [Diploptera punctata]